MKILITSGGTKVPIDEVRSITNMSSGTFGSKIATELLKLGHNVTFLKAKGSKSPLSFNFDFMADETPFGKVWEIYSLYSQYKDNYKEYVYQTFSEYGQQLELSIKTEKPDVIVLAAAVSDYGVRNYVKGKIRSKDNLTIELEPLPKIIAMVKDWAPKAKLVGFKLLVGSTEEELKAAAKKSIIDNKCDMVVANDLRDIKGNKHRVHVGFPCMVFSTFESDPNDPNYLANQVALNIQTLL